ncbi:MAG: DoxX family protein [Planctomycetota bacterium]
METTLRKPAVLALTLFRIVIGFLFMQHGLQKVFGILGGTAVPFANHQMWIGGFLELTLGLCVMLGVYARWSAFLMSGQMAVAYFQFHMNFKAWSGILPIQNKGELAVVYCFAFLLLAAAGGGIWMLDQRWRGPKKALPPPVPSAPSAVLPPLSSPPAPSPPPPPKVA